MVSQKEKASLSDLELIDSVKNGDQSAYGIIVCRYKPIIAATVFGMLGNCQEADDIGQEVFIRFYRSINQFRGESELSTYLTRIAINLSLNEVRRRKRRSFLSIESWSQERINSPDSMNKNIIFEEKELIEKAINKLSEKHRAVLVLRLINGYSTEETSKILNVPLGTVLSRLARSQQKLKKILSPYLEAQ